MSDCSNNAQRYLHIVQQQQQQEQELCDTKVDPT